MGLKPRVTPEKSPEVVAGDAVDKVWDPEGLPTERKIDEFVGEYQVAPVGETVPGCTVYVREYVEGKKLETIEYWSEKDMEGTNPILREVYVKVE